MARCRFAKGTTYVHSGQTWVVEQVLLEGRLRVGNVYSSGVDVVSRDSLLTALEAGTLHFTLPKVSSRARAKGTSAAEFRTEFRFADFASLPPEHREEAFRRYELIKSYLPLSRKERGAAWRVLEQSEATSPTKTGADGRNRTPPHPGVRTLQRYLKAFEDSGRDIRSLVPDVAGGKGGTRLDEAIEGIIDSVLDEKITLVASGEVPYVSIDQMHSAVVLRVKDMNLVLGEEKLKPPSYRTIHERIRRKGLEYLLNRASSNEERRAASPVSTGPRPTRILERVEIDQTIADLIVVDEADGMPLGRAYITQGIDAYSKYPFGTYVGYEPNNAFAVQSCLLDGILRGEDIREVHGAKNPKLSHGLPEKLVVDNGKCFVGQDLKDACASLGIVLEQLPVASPHMKGRIERYFRMQNDTLLKTLPGMTFSNILDRGDYDPSKHACITLGAFRRMLRIFTYDIEAQRVHRGSTRARGIPAKLWEASALQHPPALPHSVRDLRILMLSTEHRTVQRYGIDLFGLRYQTDALTPLRQKLEHSGDKRTKVKYDSSNLGRIFVLDHFDQGWVEVPLSAEYAQYGTGLSAWKHKVITQYANRTKDTPDVVALAEARLEIRRIVQEEFGLLGERRRTRMHHKRFLLSGEQGIAPQPAFLESGLADSSPADVEPLPAATSDKPIETAPPLQQLAPAEASPREKRMRPRRGDTREIGDWGTKSPQRTD